MAAAVDVSQQVERKSLVDWTLYRDESGFDGLKGEWNELLKRSRFDTIFLTWEWQTTWWQHLGRNRGPLYILAGRDGDRLVAIIPMYAQEDTGLVLQIVGCIEVSDYLDLIIEAGREEEVYAAFLEWLQGPDAPKWASVDLCNQPGVSLSHTRLPELAQAAGYRTEVFQEDVCPIITLPQPGENGTDAAWDAYLETLDKKERHEIRRKLRRLEREAPDAEVRFVSDGPDVAAAVDAFIGLHRNSRSDKHAFMTPEMQAYFRAIALVAAERNWLQLSFLDIGGKPVASYFCFDYGTETAHGGPGCDVLVYNSGYDPASVPQLSPGWVLLGRVIEHAISLGRRHFDFLQGDEDYKHRFGGVDTPVFRTIIRRS
jgi:CelD/BcsL family acetyltransferase involved in cellulose biosynthesis